MSEITFKAGTPEQVAFDLWKETFDPNKHKDPLFYYQNCLKAVQGKAIYK